MKRRIAFLIIGIVLGAAVPAAWAATKLSKTQIPAISAYCSILAEPQVSYGPCPVTGKSIAAPSTGGEFTSTAIGADGMPIISYHDATLSALKVTKCATLDCSSKATTTALTSGGASNSGKYSSIAIGTDGLPVISFLNFNLSVAKCKDAACKAATITEVASEFAVKYTSMAIGSDGFPVMTFQTDLFKLQFAKCNDPACAGGDESHFVLDSNAGHDFGGNSSIAVASDGNPIIAYVDRTTSADAALKIFKCSNPGCTAGTPTLLVPSGEVTDVSLAIGADGLPVISYRNEATGGDFLFLRCNNPDCTSAAGTTIENSANDVGRASSIAIDTDGNPVISYGDATANTLKVAKCFDVKCTKFGIATVDSVGDHTSIAVGIDGYPVIAYRDNGANMLKVARVSF